MKTLLILIISYILLCFNCTGQQTKNEALLSELNKAIKTDIYPNIDGILVSKNDQLVIEEYYTGFNRNTVHDTRSSFKSITSLLAGVAVDKGLFSVDDKIEAYITEWKDDPRGSITVKDLLEMKSGLECENFYGYGPDCETEMVETDDWLAYILDIPLRHKPGLNWEYSSIEPELVGIIIARTSNMTLMEFAKINLFEPLNIKEYEWYITPNGGGYAAGSFFMKPIDMLKIAELVLNIGKWQGEQIVSEKWIGQSTSCQTEVIMSFLYWAGTPSAKYSIAKYGYLWYREVIQYGDIKTEVLFASGNGGQYMMVLEDYNAAVVFTGSNYGNWKSKLPFEILLKYIIPILSIDEKL